MEFLPDSLAGCLETVTSTVMSTARQFLPGLAAEEVVLGTCRFHIIKLVRGSLCVSLYQTPCSTSITSDADVSAPRHDGPQMTQGLTPLVASSACCCIHNLLICFSPPAKLGEGGYSFVYLVREAAPDHGGLSEAAEYALKKVRAEIKTT